MKKFLLSLLPLTCSLVFAQNQILVVSGGDDPGLNHYSQYLQTKTLYENLLARYGQNAVSIYFGAGNNETTLNPLLDVHKIENTKEDKYNKTDVMLAGIIPNNQMASKGNVSSYFFSPASQKINSKQNFLLFVSDHGMPDAFSEEKENNPYVNNCIDLWHYDQKLINNFTNAPDFYKACLSKNELSSLLNQINAQHIIFQMSQCFSGGFHQLSVSYKDIYPSANPKICGFTAITPDHGASGCTADADGATYQGYERSFTEWYTGIDILTGKKIREPAPTMFSAHRNATLEDMTMDIPLSTSDYYLLEWATLFSKEHFISRTPQYNGKLINDIYNNYQGIIPELDDPELDDFLKMAKLSEQKIRKIVPMATSFPQLSLKAQEEKIKQLEQQIKEQGKVLTTTWDGMMNVYLNIITPVWEQALKQRQIDLLSDKEYRFEREFYQTIIAKRLYQHPYQFDMYYLQYLSMNNNDPNLVLYQKNRVEKIKQWADPTSYRNFAASSLC